MDRYQFVEKLEKISKDLDNKISELEIKKNKAYMRSKTRIIDIANNYKTNNESIYYGTTEYIHIESNIEYSEGSYVNDRAIIDLCWKIKQNELKIRELEKDIEKYNSEDFFKGVLND